MATFPCEVKSLCFDLASPFANFSAEAPDREIFVGFSTGFGPLYPPLGDTFLAVGCVRFCESDVSQEEANLCADRQVVECLSVKWPVYRPGVDVFGNPVPVPENRQIFCNRAQSATVQCPDGNPFVYTVAAGTYCGFNNQFEADQAAASRAAQLAAESIVCISSLATQTCSNEPYASSVTATGSHLDPGTTCWDILGVLPAGIESDLDTVFGCRTGSNTLHFFGNPTVPGFYSFAIQVQDGLGNFMVKPVTMQIIGITTTSLPNGTASVPYSEFVDAGGVTNPIFAIESGSLPLGLALDSASGNIFGTPIQQETKLFTISVTEAGTGITCIGPELSIEIESGCVITPDPLPSQQEGTLYIVPLVPPVGIINPVWSLVSGTLPPGIDPAALTGFGFLVETLETAGTYNFRLRVDGDGGQFCEQDKQIVVTARPAFAWNLVWPAPIISLFDTGTESHTFAVSSFHVHTDSGPGTGQVLPPVAQVNESNGGTGGTMLYTGPGGTSILRVQLTISMADPLAISFWTMEIIQSGVQKFTTDNTLTPGNGTFVFFADLNGGVNTLIQVCMNQASNGQAFVPGPSAIIDMQVSLS